MMTEFWNNNKEFLINDIGAIIGIIGGIIAIVMLIVKLAGIKIYKKIITAVIVLLCIVGIFVVDYNRTKKEYYADYVDQWGIPKGIIKLNKSQMSKTSAHYRFERSQGKLRRVIYANSYGASVEHSSTEKVDRPSIQELIYTGNILNAIELKNARGKIIATYFWGGKNYDRIDIQNNKKEKSASALAFSFTSISLNFFEEGGGTKADIKRFKLTRNEAGYIIRKEFKRNNGDDAVAACDANGIWGFEYDLDSFGRPIEIRYLGNNGQYQPDRVGVAKRKYEYDENGNLWKVEYFGINNKPILNEQLWASCIKISDENGNIIEEKYFDGEGVLCLCEKGYAKVTTKYDEKGNLIEDIFWGKYGNPCLNKDGFAKCMTKYDERGNPIEATYFGEDGNPCLHKDGYAKWMAEYDERGNQIEVDYFGEDGSKLF